MEAPEVERNSFDRHDRRSRPREASVSGEDKISNKVQEAKGEVKERVGGATGDEGLQAKGAADKAKGNLKQAGEKVKDAFRS